MITTFQTFDPHRQFTDTLALRREPIAHLLLQAIKSFDDSCLLSNHSCLLFDDSSLLCSELGQCFYDAALHINDGRLRCLNRFDAFQQQRIDIVSETTKQAIHLEMEFVRIDGLCGHDISPHYILKKAYHRYALLSI